MLNQLILEGLWISTIMFPVPLPKGHLEYLNDAIQKHHYLTLRFRLKYHPPEKVTRVTLFAKKLIVKSFNSEKLAKIWGGRDFINIEAG